MRSLWMTRWVAVIVVLMLAGCGAISSGKRSSNFQIQMLAFENAMRWGEFQSADKFRKRESQTPDTDFSAYEGVRISSFEVLSTVPAEGGKQIVRTVKIGYYRETNPGVRSVTQKQIWEYNAEGEVWMLVGPLPQFR